MKYKVILNNDVINEILKRCDLIEKYFLSIFISKKRWFDKNLLYYTKYELEKIVNYRHNNKFPLYLLYFHRANIIDINYKEKLNEIFYDSKNINIYVDKIDKLCMNELSIKKEIIEDHFKQSNKKLLEKKREYFEIRELEKNEKYKWKEFCDQIKTISLMCKCDKYTYCKDKKCPKFFNDVVISGYIPIDHITRMIIHISWIYYNVKYACSLLYKNNYFDELDLIKYNVRKKYNIHKELNIGKYS